MISAMKKTDWGDDWKQAFREDLCKKVASELKEEEELTLQRITGKLSWQRDQHSQRA